MPLRTEPDAQQTVKDAASGKDERGTRPEAIDLTRRNRSATGAPDHIASQTGPSQLDHSRPAGGGFVLLRHDLPRLLACPELRRALCAYTAVLLVLFGAALCLMPLSDVVVLSVIAWLLFPLTEYLVHRYVLHPLIYLDHRLSARFWIRVHFAHHDRPSRTDVILASPITVIMLVVVLNIPVALIVGPSAVPGGAIAVLLPFMFYEFVHFSIHAPIDCASSYLLYRQRLHLLHHFHNEKKNYGICWSILDKIVGTYAHQVSDADRSATARNLGYDDAVARGKPLVRIEYERRYLGK
jgi:sterol desaturase/sphingolipid hydroxylase (fatty acid hydroxylase superfamily)